MTGAEPVSRSLEPESPSLDSIAQAANDAAAPSPTTALPRRRYPAPAEYRGHPWAVRINATLDSLDPDFVPASAGDGAGHPGAATEQEVGEAAVAVAAYYKAKVEPHPLLMLGFSVAAFAAVVLWKRHVRTKPSADAPPLPSANEWGTLG